MQNADSNTHAQVAEPVNPFAISWVTADPGDLKAASTKKFVKWLRLYTTDLDVSRTRLHNLYYEYCEHDEVAPLSLRRLENQLKNFGVTAHRPNHKDASDGQTVRPTRYLIVRTIRPAGIRHSKPGRSSGHSGNVFDPTSINARPRIQYRKVA
jgi:hypothetical protein